MNGHRITEMYVFVAIEKDGDEGVCAFMHDGTMLPMVGSDRRRVDSLRPIAQAIADQTDTPIRLLRFISSEVVETIAPGGGP